MVNGKTAKDKVLVFKIGSFRGSREINILGIGIKTSHQFLALCIMPMGRNMLGDGTMDRGMALENRFGNLGCPVEGSFLGMRWMGISLVPIEIRGKF